MKDVSMNVDPGFRTLYDREFPAVYRTVFLLCGDRQLAEDATQEAFARALTRWRRLRNQPWAAGWVSTTALNVARRQLRRHPATSVDVVAGHEDPDAEHLDLHAAIRALPPRQQEAVALHYLLDLPVSETAAAMGCDEGTVKTHLSRARTTLGRALSDPESDDEPTRSPHA
jgi:RNA polymerase sigma factor (sigma-70 family)